MFLTRISIHREGYWAGAHSADPKKPFRATIEFQGQSGKIELTLDPDMSKRVLALVADEVAAAGRATAEAMTAEVINGAVLLPAA